MRLLLFIIGILFSFEIAAQGHFSRQNSKLLKQVFSKGSTTFRQVIDSPAKFKYQIIYTQIDRNKSGKASVKSHYFNYNKKQYLYPASLVKLPVSLMALQKIETLQKLHVNAKTPMLNLKGDSCQTTALIDSSQQNFYPCLEGYIKKMMLASDNDAYNRTYEFLGYDYIQKNLKKKKFKKARIVQRLAIPCSEVSNLCTNPVCFVNNSDTLIKQPVQKAKRRRHNPYGKVYMGQKYYNAKNEFIENPRPFYYNNFLPIDELKDVIVQIYFPELFSKKNRFSVSDSNLNLLRKYMGMWPSECTYPTYTLPDNFKKYILLGDGRNMPENSDIRIFNVVGRAYGVIADCAYIVDFKNKVDFFISAILYTNNDEILNDNKYEYDALGLPFLSELGTMLYNYERNRKREFSSDFKELKNLYTPQK
jgi:hypothetical protein